MFEELKQGDTIGIFSSSAPVTVTSKVRYERSKRFLEEKGFYIKRGKFDRKTGLLSQWHSKRTC